MDALTHKLQTTVDDAHGFYRDVIDGLGSVPKTLPCKYFYDAAGSQLFEQICKLEEYYVTRTELKLLRSITAELAMIIGENAAIIEPGAGAGTKIQTLLATLSSPSLYVPMDISEEYLFYSTGIIQEKFPDIEILPVLGDFTQPMQWMGAERFKNRVVFFPGSTIGNFHPEEAANFLRNLKHLVGHKGSIIIGVDRVKSRSRLESAYADAQGVTAEFNKNILRRINNELGADFDLSAFSHRAVFNSVLSRVEMHLVSNYAQIVKISSVQIEFKAGETIHTENSYKYTPETFAELAATAGLVVGRSWTDAEESFGIHYLHG